MSKFTTFETAVILTEVFAVFVGEFSKTDISGVNIHGVGVFLGGTIGRSVMGTRVISIVAL